MWFQLQQGIHVDAKNGKTYRVEVERDEKTGQSHITKRPLVQSDADLVVQFGPEKFRRVSDSEATVLLKETSGESGLDDVDPDVSSSKSDVAKAVEQGASEIAEPLGKEFTSKFEGAVDVGLKVYRKEKGKYLVYSDDELLTEEAITRSEVLKMIESYSE